MNTRTTLLRSAIVALCILCGCSFGAFAQAEDLNTPSNFVWEKAFILIGNMDKAATKDFVKKVKAIPGVKSLQYCKDENAYLVKIFKPDFLDHLPADRKADFDRMKDAETVKLCDNFFTDLRAINPNSAPKLYRNSETDLKKACGLK